VTKTLTAVTSAACWQAYLAPTTSLTGTGGFRAVVPMSVVPMSAATPVAVFAAASTLAGHVQAVAGVEMNTIAPKQADKPSVTRNDVNPGRFRPGAPPS
jgi:hypothetical protein